VKLELGQEAPALVTETDGNFVTLSSPRAFPPGSTMVGTHATETYRIKVRGSRRVSAPNQPPCFRVEGRWVGLSRAQRQRVLAYCSGLSRPLT